MTVFGATFFRIATELAHGGILGGGETGAARTEIPYRGFESHTVLRSDAPP